MVQRYNVSFSGQILTGFDPSAVRESLGKVFAADADTLDKLFSGKQRMIKQNCDEATAQKYRSAMERAGAEPIIEAIAAPAASSAADKIAALAAAPEDRRFRQPADSEQETHSEHHTKPAQQTTPSQEAKPEPETQLEKSTQTAHVGSTAAAASGNGKIQLAPPETDMLRPDERPKPKMREVDTSSLSVDTSSERLAQPPHTPPDAPDTSHLDLGEVGALIPNLPSAKSPLSPNTDSLALSPEGTDFSDCGDAEPPTPELDLSAMAVAPAGADLLEQQYHKPTSTPAPDTDHISLED
jgi:hypothetical protein